MSTLTFKIVKNQKPTKECVKLELLCCLNAPYLFEAVIVVLICPLIHYTQFIERDSPPFSSFYEELANCTLSVHSDVLLALAVQVQLLVAVALFDR